MSDRASTKRQKLVAAAKSLLHAKGYDATTLADVAESSGVPLGNIYYYFKTKEDLADAVIESRREEIEGIIAAAEEATDPAERIHRFLELFNGAAEDIARSGCPYSCLAQEFERAGGPLAEKSSGLLKVQDAWLTEQFGAMGADPGAAAAEAEELLAAAQGAMVLALAYHDPDVMIRRNRALQARVRERAARTAGTASS